MISATSPAGRAPCRRAIPRRAPLTSFAALAEILCLVVIAAPTASAGGRCTPPSPQRSSDIARAERPNGGSEVTEFLPRGEYRVTRCARGGRLVVSQTVSPIRGPGGAAVLVPTVREEPGVTFAAVYGDTTQPDYATAFRADGDALRASVIEPTAPTPTPPLALTLPTDAVARAAGDACTNPRFALGRHAWQRRSYGYRINRSRFNFNSTSIASIVRGHRNWDTTRNSCGLRDITNLTSHHLGSTSASIHTFPDGASVTDRGDLAAVGCPGALACTWWFASGGGLTETDQRFSRDLTFSNVGAPGAYDYESVATHESGHSIGLIHSNSSSALTMYAQIAAGSTHARTLAKGDVRGLRARYP